MKKRFGDRKDARKVRDISGIQNIMIDLKPRRCDSDVYINYKIDVTNLIKYMEQIKIKSFLHKNKNELKIETCKS